MMTTNNVPNTLVQPECSPRQAAERLLYHCLTATDAQELPAGITSLLSGNIDEEYLLNLASATGVMPLIAGVLASGQYNGLLSDSLKKEMTSRYRQSIFRTIVVQDEYTKMLKALEQAGIPYIYLKGTVMAEQLYDNPALRSSSDLDILIQQVDMPRARQLMEEAGYQKDKRGHVRTDHPFHDRFEKVTSFNSIIELHWNLDDEAALSIPLPLIWQRRQTVRTENTTVSILSTEDCLLHLCLQQIKQMDQFLKYMCDIDRLLRRYETSLDWDYIMESGHTWGFYNGLLYTLNSVRSYFNAPLPATIVSAIRRKRLALKRIDLLAGENHLPTVAMIGKTDLEALVLARSLTMDTWHSRFAVLKRYHESNLRALFLTTFWLFVVTIRATWRRITASRKTGPCIR